MKFPPLVYGQFLNRDNRFRATVEVNGKRTWAHVPNSGRLSELFTPGRSIWLSHEQKPARKTDYDLKLVEYGSVLVSVDARLPNPLFEEALKNEHLPGFNFTTLDREVILNRSRIDFRLSDAQQICWVETKSVTLVKEGVANFPDAPTSRGRRHISELSQAVTQGDRAAVVFIVQRSDARSFSPHFESDPDLSDSLIQAADKGVEVRAFSCQVSLSAINICSEIPVVMA